jgi:hypothetical protein
MGGKGSKKARVSTELTPKGSLVIVPLSIKILFYRNYNA